MRKWKTIPDTEVAEWLIDPRALFGSIIVFTESISIASFVSVTECNLVEVGKGANVNFSVVRVFMPSCNEVDWGRETESIGVEVREG